MNEFKIIPKAPDYKMNKEGEVRRVENDKPLLLIAGKALLKKPNGIMQHFIIDALVMELFENDDLPKQLRSQVVDFVSNNEIIVQSDTNPVRDITSKITYIQPTIEEQKELEREQSNTHESEDADLIMESSDVVGAKTEAKKSTEHPESRMPKKENKEKISKKKEEKVSKDFVATKEIAKIVQLECSESIKIWKLHQAGCSVEEILAHLKLPKKKHRRCMNSIWNYNHSASMRKKADLK